MSQCISLRLYTRLYTRTLNFASTIENVMFLTKGKEWEKINTSYLHSEPGLSLYEAIKCQQFITSTFANPVLYFLFFFWSEVFRGFTIVFSFKRWQTIQWTPIFFQKAKRKIIQVIKLESIILKTDVKPKFFTLWLCLLTLVS